MNKQKLNELKDKEIITMVHTSEILTTDAPKQTNVDYIKSATADKKNAVNKLVLNLNKVEQQDITTYSKFENVLKTVLKEQEINNYSFNRVDIAFNMYNENDFKKYFKLNNYVLLLLACKFKSTNNYRTQDLFKPKTHSIAIKNKTLQVENYDKAKESNKASDVTNRLELRRCNMKQLKNSDPGALYDYWCSILDDLVNYTDELIERENNSIYEYYHESKDDDTQKWSNLTSFTMLNADNIFSSKQLVQLYTKLNIDNPKSKAKNYKNRYKIEYITKQELKDYINILKKGLNNYFKN